MTLGPPKFTTLNHHPLNIMREITNKKSNDALKISKYTKHKPFNRPHTSVSILFQKYLNYSY